MTPIQILGRIVGCIPKTTKELFANQLYYFKLELDTKNRVGAIMLKIYIKCY